MTEIQCPSLVTLTHNSSNRNLRNAFIVICSTKRETGQSGWEGGPEQRRRGTRQLCQQRCSGETAAGQECPQSQLTPHPRSRRRQPQAACSAASCGFGTGMRVMFRRDTTAKHLIVARGYSFLLTDEKMEAQRG